MHYTTLHYTTQHMNTKKAQQYLIKILILTNIFYFRRRRATLIHVDVLLASRWQSLAPPVEK